MVDLIPIGTVNRPANENNASRPAGNVQETSRSKRLADQETPAPVERRRAGNRRHSPSDRRRLIKAARKPAQDRRKMSDRRAVRRAESENRPKPASIMRKGRIIDEQV